MAERADAKPVAAQESESDSEGGAPQKKQEQIPDAIDHFLGRLNDNVQVRNMAEINKLYEEDFNKLTERHYKNARWPSAQRVADQLNIEDVNGSIFMLLYKDLYYRHVYTKLPPTYDDRRNSWENYCKLLELFVDDLSNGQTLSVGLPAQWLWDILDEFVYHYQTYSAFRSKTLKMNKEADIARLKEHPEVFSTTKVLTYLYQLVRHSRVEEWLQAPDSGATGGAFDDMIVRHTGYYAIMQLLRIHSMLGDYRTAMQTIKHIDFGAEVPLFYKIPACHVTLYFYMGFSYMMMRRYYDAIKTYSSILIFLQKTSGVNAQSYQYDVMAKKQDQMYALLLISLTLCSQPVDESLDKYIRDKYVEKQARLQRGDELCFEELFSYACPKFVSAAPPDFDHLENFNANEAHQRQLNLFLQEVKQQQQLPKIGSYMKLYTSLKTQKLANLCEMDEEGLRDQLMCVMHKTRQRSHVEGAPLSGDLTLCSEVEFYIDGDMVNINSHKPGRPHTEVFLEQIIKFQELLKKMETPA